MATRWIARSGPSLTAALLALVLLAPVAPAVAQSPASVEVERVRPRRERHATLRFLKENRDFIRARFDRLRERPVAVDDQADAVDPRLLAYGELLARVTAAADSARVSDDERGRRTLLASVTQLGELEAQLDQLERLLSAQRERLATLERDFAGDQRTALLVVVSGLPAGAEPEAVTVGLEDGTRVTVAITAEQREALRRGGVVEVFHGLVEPRAQVFEVALEGAGWDAGAAGFVSLDPARDRLTVLRLDLASATPTGGAGSVRASTWQHDTATATVGG